MKTISCEQAKKIEQICGRKRRIAELERELAEAKETVEAYRDDGPQYYDEIIKLRELLSEAKRLSTWQKITPENMPKVSIGRDWNGFISDGKRVFSARLYVSHFNAITEETELSWDSQDQHIGRIPFDWPKYFHEPLAAPSPAQESEAKSE